MSVNLSSRIGIVLSTVAAVLGSGGAVSTRAEVPQCNCHEPDGGLSYRDTSCWWSVEELDTGDGTRLLDPQDSCIIGERYSSYYLGTRNAELSPSDGWAFVNCFLGVTAAAAESQTSSSLTLRFRLMDPCSACVGQIKAQMKPGVKFCANAYLGTSHAMIAGVMVCRTSVADTQDRSTTPFPTLSAEASAARGGNKSCSGIQLPLPGARNGGLTIDFDSAGSGPSTDSGEISIPRVTRFYRVTKDTHWEIDFGFHSSIGVDVGAADLASEVSAALAKSGKGTWGTRFDTECLGGCWKTEQCLGQNDGPGRSFQWGQKASRADCTAPKHWIFR